MKLIDFLTEYREAVTEYNEEQNQLAAKHRTPAVRKFRPKRHR